METAHSSCFGIKAHCSQLVFMARAFGSRIVLVPLGTAVGPPVSTPASSDLRLAADAHSKTPQN